MVVRNNAKVFFAGQDAKAEDVLANDKTAGWGEDIVPRTPTGRVPKRETGSRHAESGVSVGSRLFNWQRVYAKKLKNYDYYESPVLDIRVEFPGDESVVRLASLHTLSQNPWLPIYRMQYYTGIIYVWGTPGQMTGVRDFDINNPSTTTRSTVASYNFQLATSTSETTNPMLILGIDGKSLHVRLAFLSRVTRNYLQWSRAIWYTPILGRVTHSFNRPTGPQDPNSLTYLKVIIF